MPKPKAEVVWKESVWEKKFGMQLAAHGIKGFLREYRFHPTRLWRLDFADPARKLAVEIDGATWNAGRHNRGSGIEKDCEKFAEAACLGWTILRVTGNQVNRGEAVNWLMRLVDLKDSAGREASPSPLL